jgi:hypothetical protein
MRAAGILAIFFVLVALEWSIQKPLSSFAETSQFLKPNADVEEISQSLLRAGNAATPALMEGLKSDSELMQLRCAKVLALRGDRSGDQCLLQILRRHGRDRKNAIGALAESFLLTAWEQRDGPPPELREKIKQLSDPARLNEYLEKHPAWAAGHVIRARACLRAADGFEARRHALVSLMFEPENFDAITVLAQAYALLDNPEQAYTCLQQAVRLNPRLKYSLREDIDEIIKAIDIERARRRRERRKELPVI